MKNRIAINAINLPKNAAGIGFYTQELMKAILKIDSECFEFKVFTNLDAYQYLKIDHPRISFKVFSVTNSFTKSLFTQVILPIYTYNFSLVHSVGNVGIFFIKNPEVVTVHDLCHFSISKRFGFGKKIYLRIGSWLTFHSEARIISVSKYTYDDIKKYFPTYNKKINIVHSASRYTFEGSPKVELSCRKDLLFVGTLEVGKRLDLLIKAVFLLREEYKIHRHINIVGAKGWKMSHIVPLMDELKMEEQVNFLGYIDDEKLKEQYLKSECFILPSDYEGFGLPILEAQVLGCPVIAADNSSMPEVGGEGALYFKSGCANSLAKKIHELLTDQELAKNLVKLGFENSMKYSWKYTAQQTFEIYSEFFQK